MADHTSITSPSANPNTNATGSPAGTCLTEGALKTSAAGKLFRARYQALRRTIGGNIEGIRKGQDMPLKRLARKTGISAGKLDYWEMGRMEISLAAIVRIAAALAVPPATLLDSAIPDTDVPDTSGEDEPGSWHEDLEVQIYQAVKRRGDAPGGMPDASTMLAMEEPLLRVVRASILFYDLATGVDDQGLHVSGLIFLSQALKREAERLYRLYSGHHPEYYG